MRKSFIITLCLIMLVVIINTACNAAPVFSANSIGISLEFPAGLIYPINSIALPKVTITYNGAHNTIIENNCIKDIGGVKIIAKGYPKSPNVPSATVNFKTADTDHDLMVEDINLTMPNTSGIYEYTATIWVHDFNKPDRLKKVVSPPVYVTVFCLMLKASFRDICAGGIESDAHQSDILVEAEPSIPGTVSLSMTGNAKDGVKKAASLAESVLELNNGWCQTTLTSSDKVGNVTITASLLGISTQTTIKFVEPIYDINVDKSMIPYDDTSTITGNVSYYGFPVNQHTLRWRISRIWDDAGKLVFDIKGIDNRKGRNFGSITPAESKTDEDGNASAATYTPGTSLGKVEIDATDETIH